MTVYFQVCTSQKGECVRCVATTPQVVTMEPSPVAAAKYSSRGLLQVGVTHTNTRKCTLTITRPLI